MIREGRNVNCQAGQDSLLNKQLLVMSLNSFRVGHSCYDECALTIQRTNQVRLFSEPIRYGYWAYFLQLKSSFHYDNSSNDHPNNFSSLDDAGPIKIQLNYGHKMTHML